MTKICKICWKTNENPLLKYCKKHYFEKQNKKPKKIYKFKRTKLKIIWKKRAERLKNNGSEVLTYKKKFNSCDKRCVICWKKYYSFEQTKPLNYAHILNKRDWSHIRNFTNNIALVCSIEHHNEVDRQISWQNKKEIEKKILNWEEIIFKMIVYAD